MGKVSHADKSFRDDKGEDLREQVRFSTESGQIWLHEHRMLLLHVEALAGLRRDLIDTLGMDRAKTLFTRMGYSSGRHDAELVRTRTLCNNDEQHFMTGPLLHTLEGVVKCTPMKLSVDRAAGKFFGEDVWENSWEGQWHRKQYGAGSTPVCWSLIGYACGYTSTFMGRPILYREVECVGMGHAACRIIGKPLEEWEDTSDYTRIFSQESIADQLLDLQSLVGELRSAITDKEKLPQAIVGNSPAFQAAYQMLTQAAKSQITVLLLGETGAGKEVFARQLHDTGSRCDKPFVAINCAAIPQELVESELFGVEKGAYTGALASRPGRFERADGGTLFLDEIGDLPLPAQAKLLRVLQEGEFERLGDQKTRRVDVRLVAATNVDLRFLVKERRFRSDLYYRLNAFQINLPPLRERKEDIPLLAKHFFAKFSAIHNKRLRGFTDKAKRALLSYPWPGNIRELQNTIERGVILTPSGTHIETHHLFSSYSNEPATELRLGTDGGLGIDPREKWKSFFDAVSSGVLTLDQVEAMLIENAVDKARGNLSKASKMLSLTRRQLAYRLERLHRGPDGAELGV